MTLWRPNRYLMQKRVSKTKHVSKTNRVVYKKMYLHNLDVSV